MSSGHEQFVEQERIGLPVAVALVKQTLAVLSVYEPNRGLFDACSHAGMTETRAMAAVINIARFAMLQAEELS